MNPQILSAFFIYFLILLGIGVASRTKNGSAADFLMGGRSLNFWLTALSAHASDMSAWLFMAFPMTIFVAGLNQSWIAVGLILGMFVNWHLIAPKLRVLTEEYNSYTLSTFFEKRFNDTSGIIRTVSALMILLFMTFYLSAGLIAMGMLFESTFGINYYIGISVAVLVVVIYTFLGGFVTVAWTDLFQALFLLAMIILVPSIVYMRIEGWDQVATVAAKNQISLKLIPSTSWDSLLTIFTMTVGWGLGYFGQPHILTKFMGIKSADQMYKAKYLGMSWQVLALGAAACVGLFGIAFFPEGLARPELIFFEMVQQIFHPFVGGFILCAVLAANMSTMDSQILVSASVMSEDFYKQFFRPKAGSNEILAATRAAVVIISCLALGLAFKKSSTILDIVAYAWSGLGSSFGPLVFMTLYSKHTNKYGAIAGIVVGGVVAAVWPTVNPYITDVTIFPMIPGFFLSLFMITLVSYLTRQQGCCTRPSQASD
jgi:solute:Na+ symporter, SSS family